MKRWLLIIGFWLLAVLPVGAGEKFYTKHDVDYRFDSQGLAQVEQNISLTNKESAYYATAYQITIQGEGVGTITGRDSSGPLNIEVNRPDLETTVANIRFNDQVVGKDKTLNFTLNYAGRPAAHNGQVWEISLPKVSSQGEIDEYNLHLTVPTSFGQLAFISPSPVSSANNSYHFNLSQIQRAGVVAAFGNFQAFDFTLKYQLDNPNSRPAQAEVPIPADTNYQRVMYSSIDPPPVDMARDEDGNWLATFIVGPKQALIVTTVGQAHLLAEPTRTRDGLDPDLRQKYLEATPLWPAGDPQLISLGQKLGTAEAIHKYVVSTLKYDPARIGQGLGRKGGLEALQAPASSVCTEFTDLFITLARAAGIPAREVNGYGYTTDKNLRPLSLGDNLFHAWPQYWSDTRQTWVSVDPTWENTTGGIDYFNKLDFNHFAFVIHGHSDTTPPLSVSSADVKYGTYKDFPIVSPQVSWSPPLLFLPLVSNRSQVTVTNPLGVALYRLPLASQTLNISSSLAAPEEIEVLLPFSSQSYPLYIQSPFWPDFSDKKAIIFTANQSTAYNVDAKLFLPWQITLGIVAACIITVVGFFTTKAWGVFVQKRLRAGFVRGQSQKPKN